MLTSLRSIVVLWLFAAATVTAAVEPLVVLIERDPWSAVVGSDSPAFALYSDGSVIYRDQVPTGRATPYVSTTLRDDELQALLSQLAVERLLSLRNSYELSSATDQPETELHVWAEGRHKSVRVYGAVRRDPRLRSRLPRQLNMALEVLSVFNKAGQQWLPNEIEVLIWPYEYSPEDPAPWPAAWPAFEKSVPRGQDGLRQVFLPRTQFDSLRSLLKGLGPKQAVLLAERRWAISYRLPFPSESKWQR